MRTIDEYFQAEPDASLFHYTGIGSVIGMAKSGAIWASHAYYLNDSREVIHACDILISTIKARVNENHGAPAEIEFLPQLALWAASFKRNYYSIFIFSLSEERSLLSQWRSY